MKVETYEVEEINSSEAATMAADYEALELIEKLNLGGQKGLSNVETATRNPYRLVTAEERAVFKTCFPNVTTLDKYSDGIIPLRVLQVASHAKETGFFTGFTVWHPKPGSVDPVLIGIRTRKHDTYNWDVTEEYLLARWGESLATLTELKAKARAILVARWKGAHQKAKHAIAAAEFEIEPAIDEMLNGGETKSEPNFSW